MARRKLDDWKTIIEAQAASGLTVAKYCQQNKINPKTFSSRKATLKQKDAQQEPAKHKGFVQVQSDIKTSARIVFETPHGTFKLPLDITPEWVGRFLKAVSI